MSRLLLCVLLATASSAWADSRSFEFLSSPDALEAIVSATAHGGGAVMHRTLASATIAHSAVPEPGAYLQLLAGLGLLGFMARRQFASALS